MPRLARALLTLIGSCRIYYVFKIKARLPFNILLLQVSLLGKKICSSSLVRENVFPSMTMAFITNVNELQALLNACSSTRDWELLTESILIPEEWFPMANARLLELIAQEIPVSNLFHLSSSLIFFCCFLVSTLRL